jgi:hypothetical protein
MQAFTKRPGVFPLQALVLLVIGLPEEIIDYIDHRAVAEVNE